MTAQWSAVSDTTQRTRALGVAELQVWRICWGPQPTLLTRQGVFHLLFNVMLSKENNSLGLRGRARVGI